ncbi:restriction endonuclease [Bacillus sp. CGMCC 1.16607]|uniref:restriction endonuclease n=1 Tax=Bacillus sp. CGMCC 1.16607 TaxID=3351842 RepID=UPI00363DB725
MARRKSATKRESEFVDNFIGFSSLGVFFIVYMITKSFETSITIGIIGFIFSITYLIIRKKKFNEKVRKSKIQDVDTMTGVQFEYFLKLIFSQKGYKVQTTKVTGDYGADLVMTTGDKRIVVQAKRYSKRVGIKAIQEVVSSIAFYKASEGWAITNNEFTDAAVQLAKANGIKLIERNELINMISQLDENQTAATVEETIKNINKDICPKCGSEMIKRRGNRGEFYGCSSFPRCKYTKAVG